MFLCLLLQLSECGFPDLLLFQPVLYLISPGEHRIFLSNHRHSREIQFLCGAGILWSRRTSESNSHFPSCQELPVLLFELLLELIHFNLSILISSFCSRTALWFFNSNISSSFCSEAFCPSASRLAAIFLVY